MVEYLPIGSVNLNPDNPRIIKDHKFDKLVNSIKSFPEMLKLRPIVIDENNVILGGNMRFRACAEAGMQEVPILRASGLTEEQKNEFVIKDNMSGGDWDFEALANEFDFQNLVDWGFDECDLTGISDTILIDDEDTVTKSTKTVKCPSCGCEFDPKEK